MSAAAHSVSRKKSKRTMKKSTAVSLKARIPRNPWSDQMEHSFCRMMQQVTIQQNPAVAAGVYSDTAQTWCTLANAGADNGGIANSQQFGLAMKVVLSEVVNYAEFTTLFNQYRIDKVKFKVELTNGPSYNAGAGSILPTVYSRYDPNDATIPADWTAIAQSGGCKQHDFASGKGTTLSCVPKPAIPMYVAGFAAGYGFNANSKAMWLDASSPSYNIEHYAYKLWVRNFVAVGYSGMALRITPYVYMTFKRTH